ncbi:MAG TPA: pilus assembly protein TadG-related protein [Bryobacteraceae bacterium]|nr:pilus assembly protein TadG-related protein [Bryobacteraceae bacterium]
MPDCRSKRGFVLIATSIALVILIALAGLGIDMGRMYLIKSELQAFADAAALSAALRLDGSEQGIEGARQAPAELAAGPNAMKWDMGTRAITETSTSFAKGETAPDPKTWQVDPKSASELRFVRVVASAQAPVIFLRAFQPMKTDATLVAASSVAVKTPQSARLIQ